MKVRAILFQLLLCGGLIVSCNSQSLPNSSETSPPLEEEIKPTQIVTFTKGPTWTPRPTATKKPSITPTWTLPAKLTFEEAGELILELVDNNGGCEFPCWWGITPGISRFDETRGFLAPLADNEIIDMGKNNIIEGYLYTFLIPVSGSLPERMSLWLELNDNIVEEIQISTIYGFSLSSLLEIYGKPAEIRIFSNGMSNGPTWYFLFLFYPDRGFVLEIYKETYHVDIGDIVYVNICPITYSFGYEEVTIKLWDPEITKTFDETVTLLESQVRVGKFIAYIEEATNYTVNDFYQNYLLEEPEACFQSPVFFWISETSMTPPPD